VEANRWRRAQRGQTNTWPAVAARGMGIRSIAVFFARVLLVCWPPLQRLSPSPASGLTAVQNSQSVPT